jgi:hypothetical protein
MEDIGTIVDAARIEAANATPPPETPAPDAPPAEVKADDAEKPAEAEAETPPSESDPADTPDPGAQKPTEDDKPAEPTQEPLEEAYRLAGIDPKDPQATTKLAAAFKAAKAQPAAAPDPKAAEPAAPDKDAKPLPTLDDHLKDFASTDKQCQAAAVAYQGASKEAEPVRANLAATEKVIADLERVLNPPKIEGLELPPLDELLQADTERALAKAERQQRQYEKQLTDIERRAQAHADKYNGRVDAYRNELIKETGRLRAELQEQEATRSDAQATKKEWSAAFDTAFKDSKLPPEVKERTRTTVQAMMGHQINKWIAEGEGKLFDDIPGTVTRLVKAEAEAFDQHHVLKSKAYGLRKVEDATVKAPPAIPAAQHQPGGKAPVKYLDRAQALDDFIESARAR